MCGKTRLGLHLTTACQADCPYCVNTFNSDRFGNRFFNEEKLNLITEDLLSKHNMVSITGGEPTIESAETISAVLDRLKFFNYPIKNIQVTTNGFHLERIPEDIWTTYHIWKFENFKFPERDNIEFVIVLDSKEIETIYNFIQTHHDKFFRLMYNVKYGYSESETQILFKIINLENIAFFPFYKQFESIMKSNITPTMKHKFFSNFQLEKFCNQTNLFLFNENEIGYKRKVDI